MSPSSPTTVAVIGASGYSGAEFLRLAAAHPDLSVVVATGDSQAGTAVADLYPGLAAAYPELSYVPWSPDVVDGVDVALFCLPHGLSGDLVPQVIDRVGVVLDVAADYRLQDASLYDEWYGAPHPHPELLPRFGYGLPELFREELVGRDAVALPGCYPTTASLALAPLVRLGLIEPSGVIVDAASGVSGAGRKASHGTAFCTVDENMSAYGLLNHRHTPEIEVVTGASVLFTPHLVPMNRGILATCYARPAGPTSTEELLAALGEFYADEPFVVVSERSPSTKATLGSNCCHLTARYDERTGTVVVLSALDNLVKGTAGQAVQVLNLLAGRPETIGLPLTGVTP